MSAKTLYLLRSRPVAAKKKKTNSEFFLGSTCLPINEQLLRHNLRKEKSTEAREPLDLALVVSNVSNAYTLKEFINHNDVQKAKFKTFMDKRIAEAKEAKEPIYFSTTDRKAIEILVAISGRTDKMTIELYLPIPKRFFPVMPTSVTILHQTCPWIHNSEEKSARKSGEKSLRSDGPKKLDLDPRSYKSLKPIDCSKYMAQLEAILGPIKYDATDDDSPNETTTIPSYIS